jgi:hypothetical protein
LQHRKGNVPERVDDIYGSPCVIFVAILRNVFRMKNSSISQSRQRLVELPQIIAMHEKIQIHRLSGRAQKSQRKSANCRTTHLEAGKFRKESLHDQSKVHTIIVDVATCSGKS